MCQSHTGRLTGLWFLPKPAFGLNTNDDVQIGYGRVKKIFWTELEQECNKHNFLLISTCILFWLVVLVSNQKVELAAPTLTLFMFSSCTTSINRLSKERISGCDRKSLWSCSILRGLKQTNIQVIHTYSPGKQVARNFSAASNILPSTRYLWDT